MNVRKFLKKKNIEYIDHLIDLTPHEKDEMIERTGLKYYPQIFIGDKHIGGEEDLLILEAEGKLDRLLGL